jgi:hypothetical protein
MTVMDRDWLRNARIFALESWWPPFWPHLEVDWDRALWTMKRLHLDTLQANGLTKWACYPTDLVARHPELGERDLLQEAQDFCQKHGFRWIIYSLFAHAMPISSEMSKPKPAILRPMFPDQTIHLSQGHRDTVPAEFQDYFTRFHFGDERYVGHCPFAAEDWLLAMVGEMADRYEYHAAWLDGSIASGWVNDRFWNVCTCPTCQQAYLDDFRAPMPILRDLGDPRLIPLRRWAMKRLAALLSRVVVRFTKGHAVPIVGNMAWPDEACHYPSILENLDGGLLEHAPDQIDLVRKVSEARQVLRTSIHYPDCYDPWPRLVTAGWEVENKGLTILAYGGTPYLAQPGKYYYDDSNDEPARRIFELMERARPVLERQERYAYVAVPSLTQVVPAERFAIHTTCARGWVSAMLDTHIPVTSVPFYQLEDAATFAAYPALVLADMEMMSSDGLRNVHDFIRNGGGLYLDYEPARMDTERRPQDGKLLAALFDLHDQSPTRQQLMRRHRFEGSSSGGVPETYDIYMKPSGSAPRDFPLPGKKVQPAFFGHVVPGDSWTIVSTLSPTDDDSALCPAVAVKTIGKGRVVFSTVAWGRQYSVRRDPVIAQWLRDLILWLGKEPLPVSVQALRLLQLGTMRVSDGWLLYLVNQSNDVQNPRQDWREFMKVAERPLPIGPATITVAGGTIAHAIYGPQPSTVAVQDGVLTAHYSDFHDHVVLHVR